jgi:polysaccharide export outer membrane protein
LPLNITGTRLLDAVALAGGPTAPAFDTIVQLNRDGMTRRLRLSSILSRPAENIYLRRADVIYVLRDPEFIVVLGATKSNLRFAFDAEHMSLAELLAQAGGLVDLQAEPTGVFVFRLAPASLVAGMVRRAQPVPNKDAIIPVIFQADLRRPEQLFLAQEFQLENKDIVYVTDAEVVQLDEVLRLILHAAEIVGIAVSRTNVVPIP